MIIYMDYYETSPPPHLMIPTASTLLHLVSLVAFSLSSHFTPCLPHQPRAIVQICYTYIGSHPSHKQPPRVPCLVVVAYM
jgi:hypothetical protein